jgi:DNA invertase Pin-like site-specific DNA recombinase
MTIFGYARVSTNGQDLTLQIEQLRAAGATQIYQEKMSGARSDNRPQLHRLLKAINYGDTVLVCRLDRLARSTLDLLNIVDTITKAGSQFKSLADAWADTTTPHGRLLMVVLNGLASFERDLIMARTQAGIQRARELGVQFGRPPRLNVKQKRLIAARYAKGETMAELATDFGVSDPTIWRALNPDGKKGKRK